MQTPRVKKVLYLCLQAEHIYEVQTLPIFMEWLYDGPLLGGYTSPTRDWVSNVLIEMNPNVVIPHKTPGWVE